ncbi:branched-chain amino acid transport system II carrier protein [Glaesserella parasuis]|uniref:Branched-chain amino acid transport system carrier protein n=1 Tax=Glaesserella parasuis HPS10 TaxID=1450514 RepID=A0A836Z1I6_GLAPU|nr:branched-chain amino acid transport system II carrier protein [Glaesserella parasuis]EQA13305.1 branched-chain amino acid transport system II carrier protein [Glaesserella parasuis SW140]KDB45778.1 branched-chain amino acid ABC transporter substrate-binding protein [Glaesserella parasuis HPS10]MCT8516440.1 branched-chain amino acid transport system II carrier protein [Glaesserella parasuis]MCT8539791.1 branched-chain amino acid transport system II carrier protein [Glaesserella parasuis]MCT8
MVKNIFVIGFMLFAIFFGAGNLIFPPKLGFDSGADFWTAILGFTLTGVGLPLIATIVAACYEGGYKKALENIHPAISLLLLAAIYLTIGPFFAIPRTGATAYDMAIVPFVGEPDSTSLFIFTAIYFGLSLWLSLNPSKMIDRIGSILTPALLILIIALVIKAIALFSGVETAEAKTLESPLTSGILEGYQTMDALAAFAFSVLVINGIKAKNANSNVSLVKQTTYASFVAAISLAVIYISIGWIGYKIPLSAETVADVAAKGQNLGVFILNETTTQAFGELGRTVLGFIVTLACLTTAIGLIVSTSAYFNSIFPKISYQVYAVIFTLIGFGLANQGLNEVISKSVPVLLVLYPISMTALLVLLVNLFFPLPRLAQGLSIVFVTVISILSVAGVEFIAQLPLKAYSMEWLPFALVGCVIGYVVGKVKKD